MNIHKKYISRCMQLAQNGLSSTYPNPLVGSIIVYDNRIIGEGWHYASGKAHAEVHAIQSVKEKGLLKKATLYVNLEPCAHFGKTPPCSQLIIDSGIKNVVVANVDPNPLVKGKGINYLKENGCNVTIGVLEKEGALLNKRFFTFQQKKRPFIILKWAENHHGLMAPEKKTRATKTPFWISNSYAQQWVHKLRAEEHSILIGTKTALEDNPSLTTRKWFGENPIRLIIDQNQKINTTNQLFKENTPTFFISKEHRKFKQNDFFETIILDFNKNIPQQICDSLYTKQIQSLIVEGGATTLEHFIQNNLWDEAFIFKGTNDFNRGLKAPLINQSPEKIIKIKDDFLRCYQNNFSTD